MSCASIARLFRRWRQNKKSEKYKTKKRREKKKFFRSEHIVSADNHSAYMFFVHLATTFQNGSKKRRDDANKKMVNEWTPKPKSVYVMLSVFSICK